MNFFRIQLKKEIDLIKLRKDETYANVFLRLPVAFWVSHELNEIVLFAILFSGTWNVGDNKFATKNEKLRMNLRKFSEQKSAGAPSRRRIKIKHVRTKDHERSSLSHSAFLETFGPKINSSSTFQ